MSEAILNRADVYNETPIVRRCVDCKFSSAERPQRGMIEPVLMCRHGPLVPVAIMVPTQGGAAQQIRALAPAVGPEDWCYQFAARTLPAH